MREEVKIWIRIRGNYYGSGSSKIIRFLWIRICNTWLNLNTFFIQDACNIMHTLRCVQYVGVCDILTWKINLNGPSLPPLPRHMRLQEVKQVCSCLNGKVHSPTHTNTHTPIQLRYCRVQSSERISAQIIPLNWPVFSFLLQARTTIFLTSLITFIYLFTYFVLLFSFFFYCLCHFTYSNSKKKTSDPIFDLLHFFLV